MVYVKDIHQTGATAQLLAQKLDTLIQAAQWELDTKFRSSNPGDILRAAVRHSQDTLNSICEPEPEAG
jgi:hypothetical protein